MTEPAVVWRNWSRCGCKDLEEVGRAASIEDTNPVIAEFSAVTSASVVVADVAGLDLQTVGRWFNF